MRALTLAAGGEADVVSVDGVRAMLSSTTPAAPGMPLEATVVATGTRVRLKVAWCKRREGDFEIAGRLVDATRAVREELAALIFRGGSRPAPTK